MEDATKEFQVYLSPIRDYQPENKDSSVIKHRIVPVINNFFQSSSSTIALNQRKSSIYKAVSGVSFQDTDVRGNKKCTKKYNRRKSLASTDSTFNSNQSVVTNSSIQSTTKRRSRSMSSVENSRTVTSDVNKIVPVTVHPFAPVILHSQSSGRKSRYSRIKERRRSSSQARYKTEYIKYENGNLVLENHQPPAKPRRTRSASRPRQALSLAPFNEDNDITNVNQTYIHRLDRKYRTSNSVKTDCIYDSKYDTCSKKFSPSEEKLDLSVTDTDWRKYNEIIAEKLDFLVNNKVEPEGGYFSLEREEAEVTSDILDGDHFQQDNSSECIYIAQGIEANNKDGFLLRNDQYMVEELYSEVPFLNESTEVGYLDDEGLYEEIFVEKDFKDQTNLPDYEFDKPTNIIVSLNSNDSSFKIEENKDSDLNSSYSVVYINGENLDNVSTSTTTKFASQKSIDNNDFPNETDKNFLQFDLLDNREHDHSSHNKNSSWCGCEKSYSSNHNFCCIKSMSGLMSTKQSMLGSKLESPFNVNAGVKTMNETLISTNNDLVQSTQQDSLINCRSLMSTEHDLSDIDLEMFAPKEFKSQLKGVNLSGKANYNSGVESPHMLNLNYPFNCLDMKTDEMSTFNKCTSTKAFQRFLQNPIFNQIDSDPVEDSSLVIKHGQIITCITDSSSDDSSNDESFDNISKSPWRKAQNEFEFVKFESKINKSQPAPKIYKPHRNYSSKGTPNSSGSFKEAQLLKTSNNQLLENSALAPERPSRRRHRKANR